MSASPWSLDGHIARVEAGPLRALIDLRDPAGGLQEVQLGGQPVRANLLGVLLEPHVPTSPADAYVRCKDLVATYPASDCGLLRVQVYWRCQVHLSWLAIELQVSVQTDQLGIATPLVAHSQLEAVQATRLSDAARASVAPLSLESGAQQELAPQDGPGCLLFDVPASNWTYVEMIHPADFQGDRLAIAATPGGARRASLEHRLFPGSLEKGVILRSRVRGLFIPKRDAVMGASAGYQEFLRSPLPLTT